MSLESDVSNLQLGITTSQLCDLCASCFTSPVKSVLSSVSEGHCPYLSELLWD